jgi:uncharacterized protein
MIRAAAFQTRQCFVDTSAHFAVISPEDTNHHSARRISLWLMENRWRLITTNFIVAETHALTLTRLGRTLALRVLRQFDENPASIIRVTLSDERRARAIIEEFDDKNFSYTDATSFAVMDRLDVTHAFHFDRNFTQYGFIDLAQQL